MRLKTQILISVLGITLFAQLVFGLMAYHQITESRGDQLTIFLQYLNREVAERLTLPGNAFVSKIYLEELRRKFSTPQSILLVQRNNAIEYTAGDMPENAQQLMQQLLAAYRDETKHGLVEVDGNEYYWALSQLPNPEYQLVMLEPAGDEEAQIVSTLQMRLLSSGFIILWVAVWISLVLASKISRRLEEQNDQLEHQALHDSLTGLPNRALLNDRIEQVLLQSERRQQLFALFIMDLDRFKEVNDTLGHQFGDELLKKVGQRLMNVIREKDTIARLGGDEFAVLMPDTDLPGAELCAQRILQAMDEPYIINTISTESKVSIGIALYPDHGESSESLMQFADVAMYQAKKSHSGYVIYNPLHNYCTERRLQLMNDIREAIDKNVITAAYQPLVNHAEKKIVAVEVLARWHHSQLGNISPDEFIPMVEQIGLMRVFSMQILRQALNARKEWLHQGYELDLAINISTQCLQDLMLPDEINAILQMHDTPASCIELEITESALMHDLNRTRTILDRLNEMGHRLSIDDFGTGFSSLAYLKNLSVDTLKIDKSFIDDFEYNMNDRAIVKTIIELAHNLDCQVIAEGVESRQILEILVDMDVDVFQGFYFTRALASDQLIAWLNGYYAQEKYAVKKSLNKT